MKAKTGLVLIHQCLGQGLAISNYWRTGRHGGERMEGGRKGGGRKFGVHPLPSQISAPQWSAAENHTVPDLEGL